MNNVLFLLLCLIPLFLSLVSIVLIPLLDKGTNHKSALVLSGACFLLTIFIVITAFFGGRGIQTRDTEVWNGQVVGKERVHDTYEESYSCNCRTVSSTNGTTRSQCDTCYRTHYTVTWKVDTTLGTYRVGHEDSESRRVYLTPDPTLYTRTQKGEACSKLVDYTNYIKAVPESLYRPTFTNVKEKFQKLIPNYPNAIYDEWRLNRVLPMGVHIPDLEKWNRTLADRLKTLGPAKQVNAVIVVVNTSDPNYTYALQDAWIGGKKNDVVLIIGATKFPGKADWVSVMALTNSDLFKVKLRDDVMALDNLNALDVINTLSSNISTSFSRKKMSDFKYLESEIDPPAWLMWTSIIAVLLVYAFLWIYVYKTRIHARNMFRRNF